MAKRGNPGIDTDYLASVSQKEIAYCFGVSPRRVREWEDCPRNDDGNYDLQQVVAWHTAKKTCTDDAERLLKARADKEEQLAAKESKLNQERQERLVDKDEFREVGNLVVDRLHKCSKSLQKKFGSGAVDILNGALRQIRRELRKQDGE